MTTFFHYQRHLVALSLIFFSSLGFAENSICQNFAKYLCSQNAQEPNEHELAKQSLEKISRQIDEKFFALLKDQKNNHFKSLALDYFKLENKFSCDNVVPTGKSNSPQDNCLRSLASHLSSFLKLQMLSPGPEGSGPEPEEDGSQAENLELLLSKHHKFIQIQSEVLNLIKNNSSAVESEKRLQRQFPLVKKSMLEVVSELPVDSATKKFLTDKISDVALLANDCSEKKDSPLSSLFMKNAYYRADQTILVCRGLLRRASDEPFLILTLAHELAHAIDPCTFSIYRPAPLAAQKANRKPATTPEELDSRFYYPSALQCLRTEKSAAARYSAYTALGGSTTSAAPGPSSLGLSSSGPSLVTSSDDTLSACSDSDQIREAYADWMAAEVVARYLKNLRPHYSSKEILSIYSKMFSHFCNLDVSMKFNILSYEKRINAIFLQQPFLRSALGCHNTPSTFVYCSAKEPLQTIHVGKESLLPSSSNRGGKK